MGRGPAKRARDASRLLTHLSRCPGAATFPPVISSPPGLSSPVPSSSSGFAPRHLRVAPWRSPPSQGALQLAFQNALDQARFRRYMDHTQQSDALRLISATATLVHNPALVLVSASSYNEAAGADSKASADIDACGDKSIVRLDADPSCQAARHTPVFDDGRLRLRRLATRLATDLGNMVVLKRNNRRKANAVIAP